MRANHLNAAVLAAALMAGFNTANATTIDTATDGRWYQFDVDDSLAGNVHWTDAIVDSDGIYRGDYSDLSFTFTLNNAGTLTIVDAGIAGDVFQFSVNGQTYTTSTVNAFSSVYSGTDFEAALTDSHFSALTIQLAPGNYTVTGALAASAIDDTDTPYNATVGGLRVSEVPLPASVWLFATAIAAGAARTRRTHAA